MKKMMLSILFVLLFFTIAQAECAKITITFPANSTYYKYVLPKCDEKPNINCYWETAHDNIVIYENKKKTKFINWIVTIETPMECKKTNSLMA
jgi:hypothetical protein